MNEDSSAEIVARLYAEDPKKHGLIPEGYKKCVSFQNGPNRLISQSKLLFRCYGGCFYVRGRAAGS
jgi:hypothetical protein